MCAPNKYILILLLTLGVLFNKTSAQQVNTLYFMDNVPLRHTLNPSFQPTQHLYISLPVIGFTQFSIGNNSVSMKDVIYNYNGTTVSAFDAVGGNNSKFYRRLSSTTSINASAEVNLMSIGLKHKDAFWSFSLTEKFQSSIGIPKDIFKIALFGTPELFNNDFELTTMESDATLYTEAALGYATKLNKKWAVGGKLKYLYGTANFSNINTDLYLNAGVDKWTIAGAGSVNYSSPIALNLAADFSSLTYKLPKDLNDWMKKSGSGFGVDIGATYKASKVLTLSAGLVDLGFIKWKRNALNVNFESNFTFDGIGVIDSIKTISGAQDAIDKFGNGTFLSDSLVTALKAASVYGNSQNSYRTATPTTLNVGAEYALMETKLTLGLLSRTQLFKKILTEEITLSLNAKPVDWFNASVSTSLFAGRLSSVGTAFGLRTGFVHWFLAADYIPFQKSTFYGFPIPYTTEVFNFALGINLVFDQPEKNIGLRKQKNKKGCISCGYY